MTTKDIANKLVALMKKSDYDSAYEELFSPDLVSVGPKGSPEETPTVGMEAMKEKGEKWNNMMEKFISSWVSEPVVGGNFFSVAMGFTCIYKGQETESSEEEIIVYQVEDGKIIKEEYFYDVE